MKKLNAFLFSFFMMSVCILPFQNAFAGTDEAPLKPGTPGPGDVPASYSITSYSLTSYSLETVSISPVTMLLSGTNLTLNFNNAVGTAQVTIEDEYGFIVYQNAINTNKTLKMVISTYGWSAGNYTVNVSYGTTFYSEGIQL